MGYKNGPVRMYHYNIPIYGPHGTIYGGLQTVKFILKVVDLI